MEGAMRIPKTLRRVAVLVVVCALPFLWIVNCSGPRPEAHNLRVQPPQSQGDAYHLSATIENTGPGHGMVQVTFRLRDQATGKTYQSQDTVTLQGGEITVATADIDAPLGHYSPEVEATYPPG